MERFLKIPFGIKEASTVKHRRPLISREPKHPVGTKVLWKTEAVREKNGTSTHDQWISLKAYGWQDIFFGPFPMKDGIKNDV